MEEFVAQTKLPKGVDELIEKMKGYFTERIRKHVASNHDEEPEEGSDVLGFIIAGYDPKGIGRIKNPLFAER